jgi:hypothetical protein
MNLLLTLPLFDPGAQPASWNERMSVGEYGVHYSSFDSRVPRVSGMGFSQHKRISRY